MSGKVFVNIIPPFFCEHKTNHDDISTLIVTFYTLEINRFAGVTWPTNGELYATMPEWGKVEAHTWQLLFRFTSDWRASEIMHARFIKLAQRARKANIGGEDVAKGDSTEYIDDSTSMECWEANDDLPSTQVHSEAESGQEENEEEAVVDLTGPSTSGT